MLHFYSGTDSEKMRAKLDAAIERYTGAEIVRVSDAHAIHDLQAALGGGGMFSTEKRAVVLEHVLSNPEMYDIVAKALPMMRESEDVFYIVAAEVNAATRKQVEKYAEKSERFDLAKGKKEETVFALANALQNRKKKDLWVGYQREIAGGKSPESIHGVLFWAAKQQLLRSPSDAHARYLVAQLAELPHEARRAGFDMEYALERFVLSVG